MGRSLNFALLAMVLQYSSSGTGAFAPQVSSSLAPPVHLTAEQDHQRILELLHIASLGRGPDGDPKSPHAANFDESKVAPYPNLPDPLILKNGSEVVMEKVWWEKRRPEIVEDFDREIYGRVPKDTPKVNWEVTSTANEKNGDIPVITKKLVGHVDNSSYPLITVDIQVTLTMPAVATDAVPIMMELGSLSPEVLAEIRKRFKEHAYKVAQVTLSFGDYAYNEPYARCLAKNDHQGIEWLKQRYRSGAAGSLSYGQEMSNLIYGRDIKHVMLLHIDGFETVMLPKLLGLLKQRNFKLITLPEAESDPAYAIDPNLPSDWGGTFLQQMMVSKHIPEPSHPDDSFAKLDALCR